MNLSRRHRTFRAARALLALGAALLVSRAHAQSFTGTVPAAGDGPLPPVVDTGIVASEGQGWSFTASGIVDLHAPGPPIKNNVAGTLSQDATAAWGDFSRPGGYPNGYPNPIPADFAYEPAKAAPAPYAPLGALLVGQIDPADPNKLLNPQQVFSGTVGEGPFTMFLRSTFNGKVGLQVNDFIAGDNAGAFAVTIGPGPARYWDPAKNFSAGENPSPVWSYGWKPAPDGDMTLYTKPVNDRGLIVWIDPGLGANGLSTAVLKNTTEETVVCACNTVNYAPGVFLMHPSQGGHYAVTRWTSPVAGEVTVNATFSGLDTVGPTTDVHVLLNNTALFDGNVNGYLSQAVLSNKTVTVQVGDKIDFVVGRGPNGYDYDSTALSATIYEGSAPLPAGYHPVDLPSVATNWDARGLYPGLPTGVATLEGVPFTFATGDRNAWFASPDQGVNPRTFDVPVNRPNVTDVYTLMNTYWGQAGPNSYASLEFFGDKGAYYRKDLIGNVDVRDWNPSVWTNEINGATTVQAYTEGGRRLDRQRIELPEAFRTQTLKDVFLMDVGNEEFQRVFLVGLTVKEATETVPTGPPHDNIANAQALQGSGGVFRSNNIGATAEYPFLAPGKEEPVHGGSRGKRSVWHKWTPPHDGRAAFFSDDLLGLSPPDFDTLLGVYESSGPVPDIRDFHRVASSDGSIVEFTARPDRTYYIAVDGYMKAEGNYTLRWNLEGRVVPVTVAHTVTQLCLSADRCSEKGLTAKVGAVAPGAFKDFLVRGTGFTDQAQVYVNGRPIVNGSTQIKSGTELVASLPAPYFQGEGTLEITVVIGKQISNPKTIQVNKAAVKTVPPNGTETVATPKKEGNKPRPAVEGTVTNGGANPIQAAVGTVGTNVLGGLFDGLGNAFSAFGGSLPEVPVGTKMAVTALIPKGVTETVTGTAGSLKSVLPPGTTLLARKTGSLPMEGGVNFPAPAGILSHNGGVLISESGSTLMASVPLQDGPPAEPARVVRGSGGAAPAFADVTDEDGYEYGTVSVTLDETSTPRLSELSEYVLAAVLPVYGDLNGDQEVNVSDVIMVLQVVVGLRTAAEFETLVGDVAPKPGTAAGQAFGDGALDVQDAVRILRFIVGLETEF